MALADYINSKPTIETDWLILRPMTVAEVPALKEWMPDKSIYTYWGKGPSKAEKNPELQSDYQKKCHGKGYGTESLSAMTRFCFENTELQRIWTKVDVRNVASCRMLEKAGYTREGLIRQGKMVNTWCDYYIYGILDSDFS